MSRLSIYETQWLDLVFENKNKEYGAYQLRRESSKTTLNAFFSGILLISTLGVIFTFSNLLDKPIVVEVEPIFGEIITVTPYLLQPEEPKTAQIDSQIKIPDETKVLLPIIVSATPDESVTIPNNSDNIENHSINPGTESKTGLSTGTNTGIIENRTIPVDSGNAINNAAALDKMPEFPGGINKFYNYVGNNFEKPEIEELNIFKVYVAFVIEKDGSMTDIKVIRDPGFGLGKEAIRVLKSLKTKWTPGMIGSKPVRTAYNLPIVVEMK